MSKKVWSVLELAKQDRVSVATVRGWIADGELKAFNVNAHGKRPKWRILEADVDLFHNSRSNVKRQPRRKPDVQSIEEFV